MRTKKTIKVLLSAAVVILAACNSGTEEAATSRSAERDGITGVQKELAGIETGMLERRLISTVVSCTGEIEVPPQGMASVTAPLGGYILKTSMVPGAFVRKGALLATLSNPEYIILQQSYLETSGELKFAEQDYLRQKMLEEQNATAVKKLQESESSFTVLKARLAGLKAQLNLIGIDISDLAKGNIQSVVALRAPIQGYVTNVNHHPGQFVEPREVIFELVDMSDLHLHLNVFEQDVPSIHKGQNVLFRLAGGGEESFAGHVSLVSPKRNEESRSYDVHGHIESGEEKLKPGMYVEADILLAADSFPALPEQALVYSDNKPFIITESNGAYAIHSVDAGVKMEGWVHIRNHKQFENATIVTKGATRLFAALQRRAADEQ